MIFIALLPLIIVLALAIWGLIAPTAKGEPWFGRSR